MPEEQTPATPIKVVLTGGPAAGKSTIIRRIDESYSGLAQTVPEAALMLLDNGFPLPGPNLDWSEDWQQALQDAILPLQRSLEDTYAMTAKKLGRKVLICDRGLLDGAAYTNGGLPKYLERYQLNYYDTLERYKAVWHLGSTALTQPKIYEQQGRMENLERAKKLETATLGAWKHHPNRLIIPAEGNLGNKIDRVLSLLDTILETA